MTGLEVLQQVESFQNHDRRYSTPEKHLLPVVTYSSYDMENYNIPDGKNFFFAGHWQKPIALNDLVSLASHTVDELGHYQEESIKGGKEL